MSRESPLFKSVGEGAADFGAGAAHRLPLVLRHARDPTMPRKMPPAVERALREVIGWRNAAAAPIDFYNAIYDELVAAEAEPRPEGEPG